jgi:hypothetical protein
MRGGDGRPDASCAATGSGRLNKSVQLTLREMATDHESLGLGHLIGK